MRLLFLYLAKYDFCREHMTRTLVLIFSILCSSTLFVGTVLAVNNLVGTYDAYIIRQYKDYNVKVTDDGGKLEEYQALDGSIHSQLLLTALQGKTKEEQAVAVVIGMEQSVREENDLFQLVEKMDETQRKDALCGYISLNTAENMQLKLGDTITVSTSQGKQVVTITGISSNDFLFAADDSNQFTILTERDALISAYPDEMLLKTLYLAVNSDNLDDWLLDFNSQNEGLTASKTYDRAEVELQIGLISKPLYFMVVIVVLCSVFIIMNSYKVIILDRLSTLGTFFSQGLTTARLILALILEGAVLGGIGGLAGGLLGNFLCSVINAYSNPLKQYNIQVSSSFQMEGIARGMAFSVVLSCLAGIIPILSVRKKTIKDILLQNLESNAEVKNRGIAVGMVLLLLSAVFHFMKNIRSEFSVLSLFLAFAGCILVVPLAANLCSICIRKIHRKNYGLGMLISNQLSHSKLNRNDIKVLCVMLSIITMIISVSDEMSSLVGEGYKKIDFDVYVCTTENEKEVRNKIMEDDVTIIESGSLTAYIDGKSSQPAQLICIDTEQYKTFEHYIQFENKEEELDRLNAEENGIIISNQIARTYSLGEGDPVRMITSDGYSVDLKVLSICNPKMWRGGNYNIITLACAKKYFGMEYPKEYYITTDMDSEEETQYYKEQLKDYNVKVYTKAGLVAAEEKNLKQIAAMMNVFSLVIIFLGLIAMGSNTIVSASYRKRENCLLKVVGVEQKQLLFMLVMTNIYKTIVTFLVVLPVSAMAILYTKDFMKYLTFEMDLKYPTIKILMTIGIVLTGHIVIGIISGIHHKKEQIRELMKEI